MQILTIILISKMPKEIDKETLFPYKLNEILHVINSWFRARKQKTTSCGKNNPIL